MLDYYKQHKPISAWENNESLLYLNKSTATRHNIPVTSEINHKTDVEIPDAEINHKTDVETPNANYNSS